MNVFHVHYRNTQGTLMRIMTAVSRRGLEVPYVQAAANETGHRATLLLNVNSKQIGQLTRDWHAIVDVVDVRAGIPTAEMLEQAGHSMTGAHPPASVSIDRSRAAMA
jgi:acetolactate synthase small subunit